MPSLLGRKKDQKRSVSQSEFYDSRQDAWIPTIIKDIIPGDVLEGETKASTYFVEMGQGASFARYARSFFIKTTSGSTAIGMLDDLKIRDYHGADVDIAFHVRPIDSRSEIAALERRIQGLKSDLYFERSEGKIAAMQDEIADLEEKMARLRREIEKSFRVSIQVMISSENVETLERASRAFVHHIQSRGYSVLAADTRQLDALKAMLPTHPDIRVMRDYEMSLESSNVADLIPNRTGGWPQRNGILLGYDSLKRPVFFDAWDRRYLNQHMLIIGRSGAGKTHTIMTVAHRSAHIGIRTAIVDWKGEYGDFIEAVGGVFFDLHENSPHRINPYDLEISEDMQGNEKVDLETASNFVAAIVYRMIRTYDPEVLTGRVKLFIHDAIRRQYEMRGITSDPSSIIERGRTDRFGIRGAYKTMPTLSELYELMKASNDKEIVQAAEMLLPFTRLGRMPSYAIFDGQSTVDLKDAMIIGFAINRLDPEHMRPIGLSVAARWIDERFMRRNIRQRKRLIIEEAQNLFDDPDIGSAFAERQYREGRFTNTSVTAVTQGLEVFTRSKAGIAALKNSQVKLIGKQEDVDIESVQGVLALTDQETFYLLKRAEKGHFLLKDDFSSVFLYVDPSRFERMLFTTDPEDPLYKERIEYMRRYRKTRQRG